MPGRPGRQGGSPNTATHNGSTTRSWLLAILLLLPWLIDAQQQPRPANKHSPREDHETDRYTRDATALPAIRVDPPLLASRKKTTVNEQANRDPDDHRHDERAAAALAVPPAVELAPSSAARSVPAGLTSPPFTARSLEDWEVEDFVLLATVDGRLWARDRKTGKERWHLEVDTPMVETTHFRRNRNPLEEGQDDEAQAEMAEYLWIVEPTRDGPLYIYRQTGPQRGLIHTGLTIKRLVEELSPFKNADPQVIYTGRKNTSMITVDARTGRVRSWFGSDGDTVSQRENCPRPSGLVDADHEACSSNAILVLGRTDYVVNILHMDGYPIATLRYSEWGPNNFDQDLQRQYHATLDNKYIYTSHDGGIIGFDHDRNDGSTFGKIFKHKLPSPVVRVFDVARPWATDKADPELVVLPQPLPPTNNDDKMAEELRSQRIFLNRTEDGSWYAMSGKSYPLAVEGARQAPCNQRGWRQRASWEDAHSEVAADALVGIHSVESERQPLLTISGPVSENLTETRSTGLTQDVDLRLSLAGRLGQIPRLAGESLVAFISNPILLLCLLGLLVTNQRQLRTWVGKQSAYSTVKAQTDFVEADQNVEPAATAGLLDSKEEVLPQEAQVEPLAGSTDEPANGGEKTPKRKRARGQRGGVKHRKGRNNSQDHSDGSASKPSPTIEEVVRDIKNMGEQPRLEPDVRTVPQDPAEVSGPIIRIGALEVDTEKLIGTGSNGTMVFEGRFDGREVAVKRMLIQFFDIASQETKLLRESDDHPNVIRYFAQQQAAGFLYIALELCPASLAEVIEKPHSHRELAQGGEKDLPSVLYQITNGLQHLHNLRIVHRDLKPQNILVAKGKDGKPRMLVSDFGLCKKLDGEQSSFRATTAHAAGTSGWRAPELLLDDDARENGQPSTIDASTDGHSGSGLTNADLLTSRRATRAIDIFSLGLVFFYVLTKGSHPFDCGDRYMREVNIRKGNYNLRSLEVLGDYAFEAKDLISSMLSPEPKRRPHAWQVMAHPFFWPARKRLTFLCDVSDHFEKECRDPPSEALVELERNAGNVCHGDFLRPLGKEFVDSLGKQRKYTGTRLLDLLRALRNKKNHYEDMPDKLKKDIGPLPDGYLSFWTRRFPNLLITCWNIVYDVEWDTADRFREYYQPVGQAG